MPSPLPIIARFVWGRLTSSVPFFPYSLPTLQNTAKERKNVFEKLMEAVKYNSLGQISHALYEVGGVSEEYVSLTSVVNCALRFASYLARPALGGMCR